MKEYAKRCFIFVLMSFGLLLLLSGCKNSKKDKVNAHTINTTNKDTSTNNEVETSEYTGDESIDDPEYQAFLESKKNTESTTNTTESFSNSTGLDGYNYNISEDVANFDGKIDIIVGDNLYMTQINDWYMNFDKYEGKVVEIEGYYIDEYSPYTFVGRYGPSCPYCNGGYVSFEFYTNQDLSFLRNATDWIKVIGIIRQGEDSNGTFYYIEALSVEKMDEIGIDTITD